MFGGDVIVGAILGGALVLLALFSLYLSGAAVTARKQVKELSVQNHQLAQAGKQMSEELAKRQPFMLTDDQLIKFAHMINNVRDQMSDDAPPGVPGKRLVH